MTRSLFGGLRHVAIAALALLAIAGGVSVSPQGGFLEPGGGLVLSGAHAQVTTTRRPIANTRLLAVLTPTAGQTFAVTTYADLVGSSYSYTPSVDPTVGASYGLPNNLVYVHVQAVIDGTKATATTGSCTPFVNGAVIAGMETFISTAATRGTVTLDYYIPITSAATQTIKLQCRSGDTNTFTITDAYVTWEEIF